MWKLVIPALAVALTGCGGGGGAGSGGSAIQAISLIPTVISQYKNEINSGTVFNSTVADLNGDGLDDIVLSGWAVAQSTNVGSRSGFVNLKIFIQQDNGSLIDKTNVSPKTNERLNFSIKFASLMVISSNFGKSIF